MSNLPKNKAALLICIGGVSRAGKSTLAKLLSHLLGVNRSLIISQDDYPNDVHLIPKINGVTDWEVPQSLNLNLFWQEVQQAQEKFDFVIAEGLFVHLLNRFAAPDIELHLEVPFHIFKKRRALEKRWGTESDWYIKHVWDSYQLHGLPSNDIKTFSGEKPFPLFSLVQAALKKKQQV